MIVLETERLTLRQAEESDVEILLDLFTDPRAMRFGSAAKNEADAKTWIQAQQDSYQHGHGFWIAILKESGEAVGVCGLTTSETQGQNEVEIGYSFQRCLWGRGLAEEAVQSCREYGASKFGYTRFVTLIGQAGVATRRVAEKLGMVLETQQMRQNQTLSVYALTAK